MIKDGELRRQPFLDIREQVATEAEGGLLSIAFDPEYRKNRRFYAYFSDPQGDIRVSAYRRSKQSKLRAEPTGRDVLEIRHRDSAIHYGGTVSFGPGGYLYLATGDGGPACDRKERARDPRSLLGKLLPIDPRPRGGYEIPADNPFVAAGDGTRGEIYAVGLRNPFRFSIDQRSETIAIGDVGQEDYEEINLLSLRGAAGANFGWDAFEASAPTDTSTRARATAARPATRPAMPRARNRCSASCCESIPRPGAATRFPPITQASIPPVRRRAPRSTHWGCAIPSASRSMLNRARSRSVTSGRTASRRSTC